MRYIRVTVFCICFIVLLANGAPANFTHEAIPNNSNAIAFDQRLLLQEANEGYVWPDAVYSEAQLKAQQNNTVRDVWIANNLSFTLKGFPREDNNFILPLLNRGLLNYSTGNYDKAYRYLLNAQGVMDSLMQTKMTMGGERAKIFKGEHYEQAMASLYLGLMLYDKGDYENARAMFSRAIECDRETVPVQEDFQKLAQTYTRKKMVGSEQEFFAMFNALGNDNRLAYYMLARTYMKLDESQDFMISLKNTSNWQTVPTFIKLGSTGRYLPTVNFFDTAPPSDNPFVTKERLERDNLVILIQMGFAPVKKIAGVEGQSDFLAPRDYSERKAVVYIDGKMLGEAYPMFNLMHQAVCTVRTRKDTAQTGKAAGKFALTILSALVSDDLAKLVDNKWSVAADTRRWGSLPNEVHLFSAQVEPGLHTLTVLFYDQAGNPLPHYEQTHYFVPTKENEETFLVLRSLRDKCNTVRDFFGSKLMSYNEKKNELVFNARDLVGITVGRNLDIVTIDFGDARLNQQFIAEGFVPSPGNTMKTSPRAMFARNYQGPAVTNSKKRFDQKYKGFTVTKVGVARVLQIQRKKTVCTLVEGKLDPKQTYFITDYQLPVSVIKEESNHYVVSVGADKSGTSGPIIGVPYSASTSTPLRFTQVWGSKGKGSGDFRKPCGVAADGSGNIYVADTYNNRIQVFDSSGTFVKTWGQKGTDSGNLARPWDVAVDGEGRVYVADTYNHRVQKFDVNGVYLGHWGKKGTGEGAFAFLSGIALGPDGAVYTVDAKMNRVQVFDNQGKFLRAWGSTGIGPGDFVTPMGLTVDESGNVYVADSKMRRVQKFDSQGRYLAAFTDSLTYPVDVAIDQSSGNLLVLDAASHLIWEMSPTGQSLRSYGGPGKSSGEFDEPYGFGTDGASNIFVVDTGNSRVQKFSH